MIHRMKYRVLLAVFAIPTLAISLAAQRPADAPATMTAAKPPDTVFIEELTWAEVRDLVAGGTTNVIIGTADRKSTRLNSSHSQISYAVFCLKKKKKIEK